MGVEELEMTPILYLYKILGGLPYTWKHVDANFRKSDDEAPLGELMRHNGWFIWSVIFGAARLGYFAYAATDVTAIFGECVNTVVIINALEDIFEVVSTFLVGFHIIRRSESLAGALATMQSMCLKYEFKATSLCSDKKFIAVMTHLLFGFLCITYGNVSMALETEWKPEYKAAIFEASIKPIILSLAMIMYSRILDLQGLAYRDFLTILDDKEVPEESEDILDAWAQNVKLPKGMKPDLPTKKKPRNPLKNFDDYKAKSFILDLYDSVAKVKDYFAFMVAVTLLHAMISSIVSCFVAVIGKNVSASSHVATVGDLVITLFPVFFITNAPRKLNNEVRHFLLRKTLRSFPSILRLIAIQFHDKLMEKDISV